MAYPSISDISNAVKAPQLIRDPVLSGGKPMVMQNGRVKMYTGGFSVVFPLKVQTKTFAFRCWHKNIDDLKHRYKEIDTYIRKINLPYFVDFQFIEWGITVNSEKYPTTRMDWVNGETIKEYVEKQLGNPEKIEELAGKFLEMVKDLHANRIAHGDLQHGNILVDSNENLVLVDYDSLCVPALIGEEDGIKGLQDYQHSSRFKTRPLSYNLDYFSELVIYTSLLVLAEAPRIWNKYQIGSKDNSFLFQKEDYADVFNSRIFNEIQSISDRLRYFCGLLKEYCLSTDLDSFEPLESVVDKFGTRDISPPKIIHFSSDKEKYQEGETVFITWEVEKAIKVEFKNRKRKDVTNHGFDSRTLL